ncbi:hypothetical protein LIER_02063 [Lithospermum erythrorhizon]|uniref:Transposase-associated domain-containing protein n=1 Tax=Lithospermum erythrorhizon TaxID=34254 RepID=A0AAV3NST9_LITER
MDKCWIHQDHIAGKPDIVKGLEEFLQFAYSRRPSNSDIFCPCVKCQNRRSFTRDIVKEHCSRHGFMSSYTNWIYHGEPYATRNDSQMEETIEDNDVSAMDSGPRDDMVRMVHDGIGITGTDSSMKNMEGDEIDDDAAQLLQMLEDASSDFRPGCQRYTKLSVVVRLLQLKVIYGMSNESFNGWLEFLRDLFPEAKFPESYYEANKITSNLGFTCKSWDVCPKDCMLFKDEHEKLDKCEICNTSRYLEKGKKIPAKRMRYFPLRPRLQKLYLCSETASLMKWHTEGRTDDGRLRHPADCDAWNDFDKRHPHFSSDARNVRIGLATDGFNPFHNMSLAHSTWPVVLIPYNLPPWLCMKQSFFILSTIVDGPRSPGDRIDVYLQPLIEELKLLWVDGVQTYDSDNKEMFILRAAILWTISDFPGYGMLYG